MSGSATPMIGMNMKLYRNTGSYGSPTWALVGNVVDLKMDPGTAEEVDIMVRASGGFRQYEQGPKAAAYEWDMLWKQVDTDLAAIITAWSGDSLIEFAFADGVIGTAGSVASGGTAGATFFRHECKIFSVGRDETLGDKVPSHVVAKPCYSTNSPTYNTVS